MKKLAALALLLALLPGALVACGGDSDSSDTAADDGGEQAAAAAGGKSKVVISVNPVRRDFSYIPAAVEAEAGDVTIVLENPPQTGWEHDLTLEDESGQVIGGTDTILTGSDSFVLENLEAGEYVYFCSIPGHRTAGMEGTLSVQ